MSIDHLTDLDRVPGLDAWSLGADAPGSAFISGGSFIFDTPNMAAGLWGRGDEVLLAAGEALMIAGDQGLGKTTIAQQLVLGRCGVFPDFTTFLGYPVVPGERRVLYLAMDRPDQAARSFRRMVRDEWRSALDAQLVIRKGPPEADLALHPHMLLRYCRDADADTVVIDSLKDAAIGLKNDEIGAGYNRARQTAIAGGVQVIELHHSRKAPSAGKANSASLAEVYGSTWLTTGAGSVLFLEGAAGDPIVTLHHLKQPASPVGPLRLLHDHTQGRTTVHHAVDLLAVMRASPAGLTAKEAARVLFGTNKPNDVEKARRRLEKHVDAGEVRRVDGDPRTSTPTTYYLPHGG